MKGEIFVALMAHLEEALGYEVLDRIVVDAELPSGGAYTSVGAYDHSEALALVAGAAKHLDADPAVLVQGFGRHLFSILASIRPDVISESEGVFEFLPRVQDVIHRDVLKLYPDAEVPQLQVTFSEDGVAVVRYESSRPFAKLALGLLEGLIDHYGENLTVEQLPAEASDPDGVAHFRLAPGTPA